jgi:outer membrane receptor protein involved in Fe transport
MSRTDVDSLRAVPAVFSAWSLAGLTLLAAGPVRAQAEATVVADGSVAGPPAGPTEQGAAAEPAPGGSPGDELGYESVVVGTRLAEDPFRADRSVAVVDGATLAERMPRTTPEALWEAPGVFVQQTSHGGGSPVVRGLVGPQNLILVDGVRLNNSVYRTGPVQYLNLVDALSLERVEVLRGPGSVLYGSDAMGGVIQLFPLGSRWGAADGLELWGEVTGVGGSADDQRSGHAHLGVARGGLRALVGGTLRRFGDLEAGPDAGTQVYSGYDQDSAAARLAYRVQGGPLAGWTITSAWLWTRLSDAGRTDKLYDAHSLQFYDDDDHLLYLRLAAPLPDIDSRAELTLSYQGFFERKDTITVADDFVTGNSAVRDETTADTLGLDLQWTTRLLDDRLRVLGGGMWYRDWVDAHRWRRTGAAPFVLQSDPGLPAGSSYDNYGAWVMLEGEPWVGAGGHELRLGAGYRLHGMVGQAPARDGLPAVDESYLGHVALGSVRYAWADRLTAAATYSQGFRAPNLTEAVLLGDTGRYFHIPNPDLGPERSDTVELLLRGRVWRLTLGAAGYVSLLHDLIRRANTTWRGASEVGGKQVAWDANGGEGTLYGVETELVLELPAGFSLAGNLSWAWGEEQRDDGSAVPLTRIPPLFGRVGARWASPPAGPLRGFVELYVVAAGLQDRLSPEDETDARIPDGGTPGWVTLNVRAGFEAVDRLRVTLDAQNLLDETYKYHGSGIYGPGASAVLSVTAEL